MFLMGKMNGSEDLTRVAASDLLVWSVSYGLQQVENRAVTQPWLQGQLSRRTSVHRIIPQNSANCFSTNMCLVT